MAAHLALGVQAAAGVIEIDVPFTVEARELVAAGTRRGDAVAAYSG